MAGPTKMPLVITAKRVTDVELQNTKAVMSTTLIGIHCRQFYRLTKLHRRLHPAPRQPPFRFKSNNCNARPNPSFPEGRRRQSTMHHSADSDWRAATQPLHFWPSSLNSVRCSSIYTKQTSLISRDAPDTTLPILIADGHHQNKNKSWRCHVRWTPAICTPASSTKPPAKYIYH